MAGALSARAVLGDGQGVEAIGAVSDQLIGDCTLDEPHFRKAASGAILAAWPSRSFNRR